MFPNSLSLGGERDRYSISDNDLLVEKANSSGERGGRKHSQSLASSLQFHSFPSAVGWPSRFYISTLQRWTPGSARKLEWCMLTQLTAGSQGQTRPSSHCLYRLPPAGVAGVIPVLTVLSTEGQGTNNSPPLLHLSFPQLAIHNLTPLLLVCVFS